MSLQIVVAIEGLGALVTLERSESDADVGRNVFSYGLESSPCINAGTKSGIGVGSGISICSLNGMGVGSASATRADAEIR